MATPRRPSSGSRRCRAVLLLAKGRRGRPPTPHRRIENCVRMMTKHRTRTREEWLAERLEQVWYRRHDEYDEESAKPRVSLAQVEDGRSQRMASERTSERAFFGVSALLF